MRITEIFRDLSVQLYTQILIIKTKIRWKANNTILVKVITIGKITTLKTINLSNLMRDLPIRSNMIRNSLDTKIIVKEITTEKTVLDLVILLMLVTKTETDAFLVGEIKMNKEAEILIRTITLEVEEEGVATNMTDVTLVEKITITTPDTILNLAIKRKEVLDINLEVEEVIITIEKTVINLPEMKILDLSKHQVSLFIIIIMTLVINKIYNLTFAMIKKATLVTCKSTMGRTTIVTIVIDKTEIKVIEKTIATTKKINIIIVNPIFTIKSLNLMNKNNVHMTVNPQITKTTINTRKEKRKTGTMSLSTRRGMHLRALTRRTLRTLNKMASTHQLPLIEMEV